MTGDPHEGRARVVVGGVVLGGATLAVATILLFGNARILTPTLGAVIVFQDSISGLTIGAPVTFRGVRVGAVRSITVHFDARSGVATIPVTLDLEPERVRVTSETGHDAIGLPSLVARGLRAELNIQSFVTGQSEIDLDFYPASVAIMHPGVSSLPEIPTEQSTLERVKQQLSALPLRALSDNAAATLQSLRNLSEKLDRSLPPLIESVRATSDRSAAFLVDAGRSVAEVRARLDDVLAGVSRITATADRQLSGRGRDLHTVLVSANQTVASAGDRLSELRSLTAERGVDRANIDSALRDLASASASLRGLAADVERDPKLLLTGRRP